MAKHRCELSDKSIAEVWSFKDDEEGIGLNIHTGRAPVITLSQEDLRQLTELLEKWHGPSHGQRQSDD